MDEDGYCAAIDYYCNIMTGDDVLLLKNLVSRIPKAPKVARQYLQKRCPDVRGMEEFFRDNSHLFFVENARVALVDDELETVSNKAVTFFKKRLKAHGKSIHFMKLKTDHLESAPENIISFITRFYPGKEFKHFLRSRPDAFVVYEDRTVFLIEVESVEFFKMELKACKENKLPFLRFRGHIGQAKPHIQKYINRYYPGDDFQSFLRRNDQVFILDKDLRVSLVPFV